MFLTTALNFSVTTISLAKKAKADRIVVLCKSVATGHGRPKARSRLSDKLEFIDWDPLYSEGSIVQRREKVRSIRDSQIEQITRLRVSNKIDNKWPSLCPEPGQG